MDWVKKKKNANVLQENVCKRETKSLNGSFFTRQRSEESSSSCKHNVQIQTGKTFYVFTGIKEHRAAQRCALSPWRRWNEPSAGATEKSTGRRSSGTPTTTQCQNHGPGRWVVQAISCDRRYSSTSACVHSSSIRLCSVRRMQVHITAFLFLLSQISVLLSLSQTAYLRSPTKRIQLDLQTDFWAVQQVSLMENRCGAKQIPKTSRY